MITKNNELRTAIDYMLMDKVERATIDVDPQFIIANLFNLLGQRKIIAQCILDKPDEKQFRLAFGFVNDSIKTFLGI